MRVGVQVHILEVDSVQGLVDIGCELRMNDDRVCQEVLTRAVEAVGGIQALAKLLRRNLEDVEAWLHGTRMAPMKVYFVACLLLSHRRSRFGYGNTPDEFGKRRRSTWPLTEEQAAHYKDAVKIESSLEIRKSWARRPT
jgi:hypothetical protein